MLKLLVCFFLIATAAACADDSSGERKDGYSDVAKTPEDSLFQKVMDGHDEAMAKMSSLIGYQKQIDKRIDSISKTKSSTKGTAVSSLNDLKLELKKAEEGMNKWMSDFQIDSAQDDVQKRIEYLSDEKLKVDKVRDDIFSALAKADSLLSK